jgi:hypothetical protein
MEDKNLRDVFLILCSVVIGSSFVVWQLYRYKQRREHRALALEIKNNLA